MGCLSGPGSTGTFSDQRRPSVRPFAKLPGGDPGVLLGVKARVRALVHGTEPALVPPSADERVWEGRCVERRAKRFQLRTFLNTI